MKVLLIVLSVLAVIAVLMLFVLFYGMGSIKRSIIHEVDLSRIADGTYHGAFHKGRWTYDVEVTIQDHGITAVKNTNPRMESFKELNDAIAANLVEAQRIPIDTVSGATVSTKAFLKAVVNALAEGS
jgi:uncharacterized protein with FMN-binding domain